MVYLYYNFESLYYKVETTFTSKYIYFLYKIFNMQAINSI